MNRSQQVFREQYVRATDTSDGTITSAPMSVHGNKAVLAATVINLDQGGASATLEVKLQGSYDGLYWETTGATLSFSGFGYADASQANLDYAWIRVLAQGSGAGAGADELNAVFDAYIALSEQ